MSRIFTVEDYDDAVREAERRRAGWAPSVLARHHYHAYHCGGHEVLAWPCEDAAAVLAHLLGDEEPAA
jgi:uncharacterized protein YjlB